MASEAACEPRYRLNEPKVETEPTHPELPIALYICRPGRETVWTGPVSGPPHVSGQTSRREAENPVLSQSGQAGSGVQAVGGGDGSTADSTLGDQTPAKRRRTDGDHQRNGTRPPAHPGGRGHAARPTADDRRPRGEPAELPRWENTAVPTKRIQKSPLHLNNRFSDWELLAPKLFEPFSKTRTCVAHTFSILQKAATRKRGRVCSPPIADDSANSPHPDHGGGDVGEGQEVSGEAIVARCEPSVMLELVSAARYGCAVDRGRDVRDGVFLERVEGMTASAPTAARVCRKALEL